MASRDASTPRPDPASAPATESPAAPRPKAALPAPDTILGYPRRRVVAVATVLLILATACVFAPAVNYDFINYDDPMFVSANPVVARGLSWDNVVWAWTTPNMGYFKPLTNLSWLLDAELFGINPWGFHLTNILLHAGATGLLFLAVYVATGSLWRSLLVAALWAMHPLRVEPVAWITSRKDVLSGFFGFAALLAYTVLARRGGKGWYAGALVLFAAALLSKAVFMTLPVLLLLWDYWPLRRHAQAKARSWRYLVIEKVPFALLSVAMVLQIRPSLLTRWFVADADAEAHEAAAETAGYTIREVVPLADRIANAVVSYPRYLIKMVDFSDLAVPYPVLPWTGTAVAASAALIVFVTAYALWRLRSAPYLFVGWLWFLLAMVPMLRIVRFGFFSMADRFTYVPAVGLMLAIVWLIPSPRQRAGQVAAAWVAAAVLAVLVFGSRHQLGYWRDTETLFVHTLDATAYNPVANVTLAGEYARQRDQREDANTLARHHYRRFVLASPGRFDIWAKLARTYQRDGKDAQARYLLGVARSHARELPVLPDLFEGYDDLVHGLIDVGLREQASAVLERIAPELERSNDVAAVTNLGGAHLKLRNFDAAARAFEHALALDPLYHRAMNNLGQVYFDTGRVEDAAQLHGRAAALDPTNANYVFNLGRDFAAFGQHDEAVNAFERALTLRPDWSQAYFELGKAESARGNLDAARRHYLRVIELDGPSADTLNNLGVVAVKAGQPAAGVALFRRALELNPDHPGAANNLRRVEAALDRVSP